MLEIPEAMFQNVLYQ